MKRDTHGAYQLILTELKIEDRQGFNDFVRMSPFDFENLLKMVAPLVKLARYELYKSNLLNYLPCGSLTSNSLIN
jgi:hypothetical protein